MSLFYTESIILRYLEHAWYFSTTSPFITTTCSNLRSQFVVGVEKQRGTQWLLVLGSLLCSKIVVLAHLYTGFSLGLHGVIDEMQPRKYKPLMTGKAASKMWVSRSDWDAWQPCSPILCTGCILGRMLMPGYKLAVTVQVLSLYYAMQSDLSNILLFILVNSLQCNLNYLDMFKLTKSIA